jgi:Mn-dependent DtxR family transcriptional regulator
VLFRPNVRFLRVRRGRRSRVDTLTAIQYSVCMPTPNQRATIRLIARLTKANGYAPTWAELAKRLKIQPSAVHDRLRVLREKGLVTWIPRSARTLKITDRGAAHV